MIPSEKKQSEEINKEIKPLRCDIDKLSKKQDISTIVQIKYWFVAYGVAILGIAAGAVVLRGGFDIVISLFVILLLILGLFSIIYSRQIASIEWKRELRQAGFDANQTQRKLNVPPTLKALASVAVWIMFILCCLYLVAGFSYVILSSFHLSAFPFSATVAAMFFVLGIAHLILFYTAIIISGHVE